jgi:hypothetical protein
MEDSNVYYIIGLLWLIIGNTEDNNFLKASSYLAGIVYMAASVFIIMKG